MKKFWTIIALLLVATVYFIVRGRTGGEQPALKQPTGSIALPDESAAASVEPSTPISLKINRAAETHSASTHSESPGGEANALAQDLKSSFEERVADDEQSGDFSMEGDEEGDDLPAGKDGGFTVDRRKDGSLLLDERYIVRGSGTEKDPYRVTWELLVSASESYAPDQDMYEMPPRIEFLNGKHVMITGFLFTAMLRDETTELLVMRNMWDGCCVGVPPSSYDAIEVSLRRPLIIKGMGLLESGVLSGVLRVDPYVKDNWLLGLYVLDDGVIDFGDL